MAQRCEESRVVKNRHPQYVEQASDSVFIPMGSLPAYHARRDPTRPMITIGARTVTREEFESRANRRARALAARGVQQGDMVTIALPNCIEFYETAFAAWKLGATPNPVSGKLPDVELRSIIDLVRPRVIVGVDPARLPGCEVIAPGEPIDESLSCEPLPERIAPYWKAMASGGSTGRPKIIVDHNPGAWDPRLPPLRQIIDDTLLNPGPLYHNAPFSLMCAGLLTGAHVIEMEKFDPLRALQLIERHQVGWVNFVPTMMHRIWRLPEEQRASFDVSSLRVVYHMASACPVWLKEQWIEWLGAERIWELYGGTERQGACEINGREWLAHKGSIGRAQSTCQVKILSEQGEECPPGEVGEIFFLPVGGRNSTYHYLGAKANARGEWESIGDLGYTDEDGYVYLVDRRTDLIVTGGANVYPAEVEGAIDSHPQVRSSIVIGLPDEDLGHRVHALVETSAGLSEVQLREHLLKRLARFKIPRTFEFVDRPLRDDAGKARRSALREERIQQPPTAPDDARSGQSGREHVSTP